jgi:flagellin-specific chaperone FliS
MNDVEKIRYFKEQAILTATPVQVVSFLYGGVIWRLEEGCRELTQGDSDRGLAQLHSAGRIIMELHAALKVEAAPDLAGRLASLYRFALEEIGRARAGRREGCIPELARAFATVKAGWDRIAS